MQPKDLRYLIHKTIYLFNQSHSQALCVIMVGMYYILVSAKLLALRFPLIINTVPCQS